jgi:hypothetical protein
MKAVLYQACPICKGVGEIWSGEVSGTGVMAGWKQCDVCVGGKMIPMHPVTPDSYDAEKIHIGILDEAGQFIKVDSSELIKLRVMLLSNEEREQLIIDLRQKFCFGCGNNEFPCHCDSEG